MITGQRYFPLGVRGSSGGGGGPGAITFSRKDIYKYSPTSGDTVTTPSTTATPHFGTGPFTFLWAAGSDIQPTAPTSATTAFVATGEGIASDYTEFMVCTVTDSLAVSAFDSVNVEIQIGGSPK